MSGISTVDLNPVYNVPKLSAHNALQRTAPRVSSSCYFLSGRVHAGPPLSYARCLLLRSAFAAIAPRFAVAELGVVRRHATRSLETMLVESPFFDTPSA